MSGPGDIAVRVENLSKLYKIRIGKRTHDTLRDTFADFGSRAIGWVRRPSAAVAARGVATTDHVWALADVSFDVKVGDVVGIVGHNGAGKSTLLKILSRVTEPTCGRAEIYGRVGSLLEVGTGFHVELSGRENIYLNGAILGMKKAEIDRKFDEIVAFAEVDRFIDTPMKRYSSGMYVRLAFAVAAHLEPEILIVDEVLAVGDIAFQKKCLGKIGDVARHGRTVLFVSHNMAAIESLCSTGHLFEHGRRVVTGGTREIIDAYLASLPPSRNGPLLQRTDRKGTGRLRFTDITFRSAGGLPGDVVQCGQNVEVAVGYKGDNRELRNVVMSIEIFARSGQCMLVLNSEMVGNDLRSIPRAGQFACSVRQFPLAPGQYHIGLSCSINGTTADSIKQAAYLTVEAGDFFGTGRLPVPDRGGVLVPQSWAVTDVVADVSGDGEGHGGTRDRRQNLTAPSQRPTAWG